MRGMRVKGQELDTTGLNTLGSAEYETPLSRIQGGVLETKSEKETPTEIKQVQLDGEDYFIKPIDSTHVYFSWQSDFSRPTMPLHVAQLPNKKLSDAVYQWLGTGEDSFSGQNFKREASKQGAIGPLDVADPTLTYELRDKDGKVYGQGTYNECLMKLHRVQSNSWDRAMKHEGWTIEPKTETATDKQAAIFDNFCCRVTIETKAGDTNESYTLVLNMLNAADIQYREVRRYTIDPDRVLLDINVKAEGRELLEELAKDAEKEGVLITFPDFVSEGLRPAKTMREVGAAKTAEHQVTDWLVTTYDKDDNILQEWVIKDRTEFQARREAENDPALSESNVSDWTMTPKPAKDKKAAKTPTKELTEAELEELSNWIKVSRDRDGAVIFKYSQAFEDASEFHIGSLSSEQVSEMVEDGFEEDTDFLRQAIADGSISPEDVPNPYYQVITHDDARAESEQRYKFLDRDRAIKAATDWTPDNDSVDVYEIFLDGTENDISESVLQDTMKGLS